MLSYEEAMKIIRGSKAYEFITDTILEITNYHTGESIKLDLDCLTEEMLEELQVEDDDWDEEEE